MKARFLLLLAVIAAGLGLAPRGHASFALAYNVRDQQVLGAASLQLGHRSRTAVLRWLRRQPEVRSVLLGTDRQTVNLYFSDGTRAAILPAALGTARLPARTFRPESQVSAPARAPQGRALVMEPFAWQLGGPTLGDAEVNDLKDSGFQVDELQNDQVTVKAMATIPNYNVVYIHTHTGVQPGGQGLITTGQPYNSDPSLQPLEQSGDVEKTAISGSQEVFYGILTPFVHDHMGQFQPDSLLFVNGCDLLSATAMWQALQTNGLSTLVSWDQEAQAQDNYFAGAAFFYGMKQGMTVGQAIAAEKQAGYGTSQTQLGPATLGYLGNAALTLQMAASYGTAVAPTAAATGTSVPAATAPPPATSAPAPTATAIHVNPLPLLAVLRPQVVPGRHQTVSVQSTPNTPVSVLVLFPNGDHRSKSMTTDAKGAATFSFLQHPSKITHARSIATVQIEAGSGVTLATLTKTYRIGWGRIDLSVEPRQQSVRHMIFIWVHSRPGQQVTVELRQPRGAVQSLKGQTGTNGWTYFNHRLGRHLKAGNKVSVVAETYIGQKLYWTSSSFTVKS